MKINTVKYLILLCFFNFMGFAQELVPPIQNFSPVDYAAASQNWDIAVDEQGVIYAANNQGLLVYDGLSWELLPLKSESIIRSVFVDKNKIFTGSYKEFGFWNTSGNGSWNYTSLSPLMADFDMQSDEFWDILAHDDAIFFRSFGGVYKYEKNKIEKIEDLVTTAMEVYKDKLILAPRNQGLLFLNNQNKIEELAGDLSELYDSNIVDLEARGDTLFVAGKETLYIYANERLSKFKNQRLNDLLKESELNHILSISPNELLLGTIKKGVILYNMKEDNIQSYGRASGVQNNTVLGMAYSRGNLWLALDKGIDVIDLHSPVKFYSDNSGELGAVYDLLNFNDNFYLASNTGVYTFENNQLKLVQGAEDHAWNLEELDNHLYVNHNTGIYEIQNNRLLPIENRTGSFSMVRIPDNKDRFLISDYTGISLYNRSTGLIKELENIDFPVKQIVFESDSVFWAAHPYEGIFRITHKNFEDIKVQKIGALSGPSNFNPKLFKLNDQVIVYVNDQWFRFNPFQSKFDVFSEFQQFNNSRLLFQGHNRYVFSNANDGSFTITDLKKDNFELTPSLLNNRLVKSNEAFIQENDSIYYVNLNDGFARINLNLLERQSKSQWIGKPYVRQVSANSKIYSLNSAANIPFKSSKEIQFRVAMPYSKAQELTYKLSGEEQLTGKVEKGGELAFRNLSHGNYQLELIAGIGVSQAAAKSTYSFAISPPWYFSAWMKMIYVLIFLFGIFLIYWVNQLKLKKHRLLLEQKFEKEHAERLNRVEKEKLMHEIDVKRKELANTTMMAAKKNEVLMEIQQELNKDKTTFSNQFRLKHIMNKINGAVKSKDEWKVFETNFNEVHEDFFKDVLNQYPKLTGKDLKLCSYLKMNLTSKEIAPLMGISVRGVEVHRYRLRKKMDLDSDVNLTKFLIKKF